MDSNEYVTLRLSIDRPEELRRQAAQRAAWVAARGPSPVRRRLGAFLIAVGHRLAGCCTGSRCEAAPDRGTRGVLPVR